MSFRVIQSDTSCNARTGILTTSHGEVRTPIFMPVGTLGAVKSIRMEDLSETIRAEIILGNTYHLYLRPGISTLNKVGGIHKFIHWGRPILTDSGGYQVYSLASRNKIKEEGVKISSHIDGSKHMFSPESVMRMQRNIGADIIMAFDECTSYPIDEKYAGIAMRRTHRWLDRCLDTLDQSECPYGYDQIFAPIVQGSTFPKLRKESAMYIADKDQKINAIGGLSVGEPHHLMYEMTAICTEILPIEKPRYLMGVGTPANLLQSISLGIDMFDCVLPTRNARHGVLYTWEGQINIKNSKWKECFDAIDESSKSPLSRNHSKAYLRHLMQSKELLGAQIASLHNLSFYLELIHEARDQINSGTLGEWMDRAFKKLEQRI